MPRRPLNDPPGGLLLWIVVAVELATFAMLFVLVAWMRASDPAAFAAGQAALDPKLGLALTLVLVTSGAVAAHGVHRYREGRNPEARRAFVGAGVLGVVFLALKAADYAAHGRAGHGLGSSDFWDTWFLGTGFHFAHVVIGVGLLFGVAARVGRTTFDDEETAVVGSTLFWHMCDVAWFFLFPLFFARTA